MGFIFFLANKGSDQRLCWSHIPHCWKSHVAVQLFRNTYELSSRSILVEFVPVVFLRTTILLVIYQLGVQTPVPLLDPPMLIDFPIYFNTIMKG